MTYISQFIDIVIYPGIFIWIFLRIIIILTHLILFGRLCPYKTCFCVNQAPVRRNFMYFVLLGKECDSFYFKKNWPFIYNDHIERSKNFFYLFKSVTLCVKERMLQAQICLRAGNRPRIHSKAWLSRINIDAFSRILLNICLRPFEVDEDLLLLLLCCVAV